MAGALRRAEAVLEPRLGAVLARERVNQLGVGLDMMGAATLLQMEAPTLDAVLRPLIVNARVPRHGCPVVSDLTDAEIEDLAERAAAAVLGAVRFWCPGCSSDEGPGDGCDGCGPEPGWVGLGSPLHPPED